MEAEKEARLEAERFGKEARMRKLGKNWTLVIQRTVELDAEQQAVEKFHAELRASFQDKDSPLPIDRQSINFASQADLTKDQVDAIAPLLKILKDKAKTDTGAQD